MLARLVLLASPKFKLFQLFIMFKRKYAAGRARPAAQIRGGLKMKKINKRIYQTIDFQRSAIILAFLLGSFLFIMSIYVPLLIIYYDNILLGIAIFQGLAYVLFIAWYATKLAVLTIQSNKFLFYESAEFSIVPDSMSFKGHFFAINVVVNDKKYVTDTIINANQLARAQELKKIEIGVIEGITEEDNKIVVVKPNEYR